MVQDDAAAAAVALKPQGATFVPLEALPARAWPHGDGLDLYRQVCGNVVCGRLGGWPAVVFYPVRDRVAGVGGLVAGRPSRCPIAAVNCCCWAGSPTARLRLAGEAMRLARPTASG